MRRCLVLIPLAVLILLAGCTAKENQTVKTTPDSVSPATTGTISQTESKTGTKESAEQTVTTGDTLFLEVSYPEDETVITTESIDVTGKTLPSAIVSVNGILTSVNAEGIFTYPLQLEPGPNDIQVVASTVGGQETGKVLVVVCIPK